MHTAFSVRRMHICPSGSKEAHAEKDQGKRRGSRSKKPINNKDIYAVFQNIRNVSEMEEKP